MPLLAEDRRGGLGGEIVEASGDDAERNWRLSKDDEQLYSTSEAWVYVALTMIHAMARRLARS